MSKVFAFPMAPANYTLDIIKNVYEPKGIKYAFIHGTSEASDKGCMDALVMEQLGGWRQRIWKTWRILKENDIFIVNSYTDKISQMIILMNILLFKKSMGISSDTQLRIPSGMVAKWIKRAWLGYLFTRKCIFGLPGGTKAHVSLFSHYGMDLARITFLPMMVDNTRYRRENIPEPGITFRFVYVGRLVTCKNVAGIVEAFGLLCRRLKNVELHIIGDGGERDRLMHCSGNMKVVFHGRLYGSSLVASLHTMHCLVLFSSFESWGLVVNEALASGIPCVVSDQVGARFDLIESEPETGFVVKSNDVSMLAEAMTKIATDKNLWRRYSNNAISRMKNWDYEKYCEQLDAFIARAGERFAC